jgi:hypothetical protein
MTIDYNRRKYVGHLLKTLPITALGLSAAYPHRLVAGENEAQLIWGGLGYSASNSSVDSLFPNLGKALQDLGGIHVAVKSLVEALEARDKGKVRDLFDTYDSDDGLLVFAVSFDYEQSIAINSFEGGQESKQSDNFVYCQALVLYIQTHSAGSQDGGRLSVLYGFPFRLKASFTFSTEESFRQQFMERMFVAPNCLTDIFKQEVATKSFRELRFPKGIKVASVTFSDDFNQGLDFVGIRNNFTSDFVGNALSSSMAAEGGMSVIPFRTNQMLGKTLAGRFKESTKIFELASNMGGREILDYEINIKMHKLVRKVAGENKGNVRIIRGMSLVLTVTSVVKGETIFERTLIQKSDVTISRRAVEEQLSGYDLRYFVQMLIKLFDDFVVAVMTQNPEALASVNLDPKTDTADLEKVKQVFISCIYSGV